MVLSLLVSLLSTVQSPPKALADRSPNRHYVNQRSPLQPSALQKLPTGAVRAKGWLLTQLQLQREGFSGQLAEISHFLDDQNSAWLGNEKVTKGGWEELPYWLRGQVSLAYVLDDPELIAECKKWIDGAIRSQKPDGWFGPETNKKTQFGTPDLWPNMLMQQVLQTYFEATGDKRVMTLMKGYVKWMSSLPKDQFMDPRPYWQYHRAADQMASLIWYYNRSGDKTALELAQRLHEGSAKWVDGIINRHGVNFAQGFREPAEYSLFSKKASDWIASERNLHDFRAEYGQMPGGMYGADENARPGYTDPRQAAESCAVAELMLSDELLLEFSGDTKWADDCEDVTFNWLPATMTADLKALRYLTCGNMAVSDAPSKSPGVENGGPMFLMDPRDHRCCQHNVGMAWPFFTERLWFATNGNGLMASMYAPSEVKAKVGNGVSVTVTETTDYPFREDVRFTVRPQKSVAFPLSFRVPSWCKRGSIEVNGRHERGQLQPGSTVTLDRTWKSGDTVVLNFPMETERRTWSERPGTVSIYRGPLAYSLKIDERQVQTRENDVWPSYEILPESPWNFGLDANDGFRATVTQMRPGAQPWTAETVPVSIKTNGRQIPEWTTDMYGLVAPIQASPAQTSAPERELTLIPMGAARLRITVFPTVVTQGGHVWQKVKQARKAMPATYSHRNWWDSEAALSDGLLPENGDAESVPRFTWWDHKGTTEWVQYAFPETRTFQKTRVFWFDDAKGGGMCRHPESWWIEVKVGGVWTRVEALSPVTSNEGFEELTFKPIGGTEVRLVAKLKDGFSAGILEWEVN